MGLEGTSKAMFILHSFQDFSMPGNQLLDLTLKRFGTSLEVVLLSKEGHASEGRLWSKDKETDQGKPLSTLSRLLDDGKNIPLISEIPLEAMLYDVVLLTIIDNQKEHILSREYGVYSSI